MNIGIAGPEILASERIAKTQGSEEQPEHEYGALKAHTPVNITPHVNALRKMPILVRAWRFVPVRLKQ
jgi:hypothetical protein